MADIELHKRFFGEGLVGKVDVSPTLSWSEHSALLQSAANARAATGELRRTTNAITDLGMDVRSVARAIDSLEGDLGLRLDQQTMLLDRQLDLLADIAQSLRTPARVRAAERLSSVGELLRRKRYDRALAAAEQAIADDPNNPAGFSAAGWAQIGLERLREARTMFAEAALASDGDARSAAHRQVARLTLALDGAEAALDHLERSAADHQGSRECAALAYDRSVYLAEMAQEDAAQASLLVAGQDEPGFLFAALTDPLLGSHQTIIDAASRQLRERQGAMTHATVEYEDLIRRLDEQVTRLQGLEKTLRASGKEERLKILSELAAIAKSHADASAERIARAQSVLHAEQLAPAINELKTALEQIEHFETETLGQLLRASELERKVLDFATREDAWPTKLKDGTWEITKTRRFGHDTQWRAWTSNGGEVVIESRA